MAADSSVFHLTNGGTSVLIDTATAGLPTIVYWGPAVAQFRAEHVRSAADALQPQRVSGGLDQPARPSLVAQESSGWQGTPGLTGHRGRRYVSAALETVDLECTDDTLSLRAEDPEAGLVLSAELHVTSAGLFQQRLGVTNTADDPFTVQDLQCAFPLPHTAQELLDTTGRHLKERSPQRSHFPVGAHVRQSRRGRPGADASLLLIAGVRGFGFERGMAHAIHVAWSGNHELRAERTITGNASLAGGELLLPGEMILDKDQTYATPWVIGSWGNGLNELSGRFHAHLRERDHHPRAPRPVTLNTWEAVYFNHDYTALTALADQAAAIGVERYVLDDGWFQGRRGDAVGLGDWTVDRSVWPQGLGPLIDHVRSRGMEFGLWVEPEMTNLDSNLARAHPDWILGAHGRTPVPGRQQQVLNLADPAAFRHILDRLDALLTEYPISYLKWDHNRDLLEPVDSSSGQAAVHRNVQAVYRMMTELKRRHPGLEIESCASGGARVDLGILHHCDRVWASDCLDPVERLDIQKYTGLLLPPELIGAHIGSPVAHSTGRHSRLDFRASTALIGHFGIEWDISSLDGDDFDRLSSWVGEYKRRRALLHTGRVMHADLADPAMDLRGVVAPDGSEAIYVYTQRATTATYPPGRITLPGLDAEAAYSVRLASISSPLHSSGQSPLTWAEQDSVVPGMLLGALGLEAPVLLPESSILIEAVRSEPAAAATSAPGLTATVSPHGA